MVNPLRFGKEILSQMAHLHFYLLIRYYQGVSCVVGGLYAATLMKVLKKL